MKKDFKFKLEIEKISEVYECPASEYFYFDEKKSYRFVFEDVSHPNNFKPPAKIKPGRYLNKKEREQCEGLGLSLYGDKNGARTKFEQLIVNFKNFRKIIGTHIAEGIIDSEDGQITEEDEITHFDLYEFSGSNIEQKFEIVEEL